MSVEKSLGFGDETGDLRLRGVRREWGTIMCLAAVEAEVVCTVGSQGESGGFRLCAVWSCRRGRRIHAELQWESAASGVLARTRGVVETP